MSAYKGRHNRRRSSGDFRQDHDEELAALFRPVLRTCREAGLVKVGVVAVDGTTVKANAALAANQSREQLEAEVRRMLAEAKDMVCPTCPKPFAALEGKPREGLTLSLSRSAVGDSLAGDPACWVNVSASNRHLTALGQGFNGSLSEPLRAYDVQRTIPLHDLLSDVVDGACALVKPGLHQVAHGLPIEVGAHRIYEKLQE